MKTENPSEPTSYADLIGRADQASQKEAVARDLYQRIGDHLRGDQAKTARRWPWELIQNAHDVSSLECGVNVLFRLDIGADEPTLAFEHDAGPFSPEDLVCLVKRHSGKRGAPAEDRPTPLGRFGTGFLTTHLLARHVDLSGVVAAPGHAPRPFELPLDRTGTSEEDLRRGVDVAFGVLRNLGDLPALGERASRRTVYRYRLQPDGLQAARAGLKDLERLVPFILAFVPAVRSVTVETVNARSTGAEPRGVRYEISEHARIGDNVHHVRVGVTDSSGTDSQDISLLLAGDSYDPSAPDPAGTGGVLAAVRAEVSSDGAVTVINLDDATPRLFCGLPLIGSEALGLPAVTSSRAFAPAPERDGLVLSSARDAQVRTNSDTNKKLLQAAVRHIRTLLAAATDWQRTYALAGVPTPPDIPWLQDKDWYQQQITNPLRQAVAEARLVERLDGTRGILGKHAIAQETRLPAGPSVDARATLWDLARPLLGQKLPAQDDLEPWRKRMAWTTFYDLEAFQLVAHASGKETLPGLAEALGCEEAETLQWVQRLLDFLQEHQLTSHLHQTRELAWGRASGRTFERKKWTWPVAVIPDQNGRLRELGSLSHDPGLPRELKDVAVALGHDVRDDLAAVDVLSLRDSYTIEQLAQRIEGEAFDRLHDADQTVGGAFADLLSWFDTNPDEAAQLFKRLYPKQHLLRTAEEARQDRLDAAEARRLRDENESLVESKTTLEAENAALKTELDRLQQGTQSGSVSVPLDDLAVQLKHHVLDVWEAVRKALAAEGTVETTAASRDLERLRERHQALFGHLSNAAIEEYAKWRAMVERAKERTRAKMDALGYDTDRWRSAEAFPTIIEGVRRHPVRGDRLYPPHEITLVVRPADGGFVVLYDAQEVAVLQSADAELWIEGDGLDPQRFTIGHLAEALNANRFPVRAHSAVAQQSVN